MVVMTDVDHRRAFIVDDLRSLLDAVFRINPPSHFSYSYNDSLVNNYVVLGISSLFTAFLLRRCAVII